MGSNEEELINILLTNCTIYETPFYKYTEEDLYRLRDLIIEKFRIGYDECDKCKKFKKAIYGLDSVLCPECYKEIHGKEHQF